MSPIGNLIERLAAVRGELDQARHLAAVLADLARDVHERAAALSAGLAEGFVAVLDGIESTTAGITAALEDTEEAISTARAVADGTFRVGGVGERRGARGPTEGSQGAHRPGLGEARPSGGGAGAGPGVGRAIAERGVGHGGDHGRSRDREEIQEAVQTAAVTGSKTDEAIGRLLGAGSPGKP